MFSGIHGQADTLPIASRHAVVHFTADFKLITVGVHGFFMSVLAAAYD
jgi:hypothetical protein